MSVQVSVVEKAGSQAIKAEARVEAIVGDGFDVRKLAGNFGVLAEAAGGIPKLRQLVVTLAVSGRLTRQMPGDGDAEALLATLNAGDTTARKQTAEHTAQNEGVGPFALPQSWHWAQFLRVASIDSHLVDPAGFLDLPHVAPDNIEKGTGRLLQYRTIREDGVTSSKHRFFSGQIVYSKIRPNLSKVVLVDFDGLCSADMYPLTAKIDRGFLHRFMLSQVFLDQVVKDDNRLAMPKVNQEQLGGTLVAVPPLPEQERIVARVDQLMALIDDLEARQTKKRVVSARFTKASLEALTTAEGPEEFDAAWTRVVENWDTILDKAGKATELRKAVIEMAVRGRLVPSRPDDGEAPGFVAADEAPYPLLPGWRWGRVETLASHIVDCLHATPRYTSSGLPAIRTADVVPGRMLLDQARTIDEDQFRVRIQRLEPKCGDIFYSREGERLGIAACVPDGVRVCLSQRMMQIRAKEPLFSPYIMWAMNSRFVYSQAVHDTGGSTSPHINMRDIRRFLVPVPPVAQQKRIVAKVEHLMNLCDDLEAKLRRAEDQASKLVEAVVQEMVA